MWFNLFVWQLLMRLLAVVCCRWGGDYLQKAAITDTTASANVVQLVAQVSLSVHYLSVGTQLHVVSAPLDQAELWHLVTSDL